MYLPLFFFGSHNSQLFSSSVLIARAKKGQNTPEGHYNLEKMLTDLIGKGANLHTCGTCLKSRELSKEDLVEGAEIGSMIGFAQWVKDSRNTLSF